MKYTKEQRLDIAKRVYDGELTVEEAAVKYDLNPSSVKGYLRLYRAETGLPPRTRTKKAGKVTQSIETPKDSSLKEYESMSKYKEAASTTGSILSLIRQSVRKRYSTTCRCSRNIIFVILLMDTDG